jgi:hypothetical protein
MKKYSFQKGYGQIAGDLQPEVKSKIMKTLNITTLAGFLRRLYGDVEPKISEAEAIEKIFAKYGVTEVWGPKRKSKVVSR